MIDFDFEEKKKRVTNPAYSGEEIKLIYMWVKQDKITPQQMKELLLLSMKN